MQMGENIIIQNLKENGYNTKRHEQMKSNLNPNLTAKVSIACIFWLILA